MGVVMMDLDFVLAQMECNAKAIEALVEDVGVVQARWKPGAKDWSILEVVNHLWDEEIEDFRAHLDLILHHPDQPWPSIDPQGWITERGYNQREPKDSLAGYLRSRAESLGWLRGLSAPSWEAVYKAPFGEIAAGDVLAAWVAHDLLHTRQLVELHWAYTTLQVQPYRVLYAGDW
jgi:hypothetical protein